LENATEEEIEKKLIHLVERGEERIKSLESTLNIPTIISGDIPNPPPWRIVTRN
jgi:hypothetical protein